MLYLHASYGNEESGNWESIKVIPLSPYKDLYPDARNHQNDSFGLLKYPLDLPNGEVIYLGVAFWAANNSITFVIEKENSTLLNVGAFKNNLEAFDPSIIYKTSGGLDLSFMFSTRDA